MTKTTLTMNKHNWSGEEITVTFKSYADGRVEFEMYGYDFRITRPKADGMRTLASVYRGREDHVLDIYPPLGYGSEATYFAEKFDVVRESDDFRKVAVYMIANLY